MDYYSDGAGDAPAKDKPSDGDTAVIPKSLLAGKDFKVGEEVVLKITAIHGDEVQVEYAYDKGEEAQPDEPEEPQAPEQPQQPEPAAASPEPSGGGGPSLYE